MDTSFIAAKIWLFHPQWAFTSNHKRQDITMTILQSFQNPDFLAMSDYFDVIFIFLVGKKIIYFSGSPFKIEIENNYSDGK